MSKTVATSIRLTVETHALLKKRAQALGMTLTEYIHRAIKAFAPRARHLVWLLAAALFWLAMVPCLRAADPPQHRTLWAVSIAAMAGAEVADAISTRQGIRAGLVEANPLMRSDGALIKSAAVGAIVVTECLFLRNRSHRGAAILNFATAGALAGIAARNERMR
jgi:hypothetical protein